MSRFSRILIAFAASALTLVTPTAHAQRGPIKIDTVRPRNPCQIITPGNPTARPPQDDAAASVRVNGVENIGKANAQTPPKAPSPRLTIGKIGSASQSLGGERKQIPLERIPVERIPLEMFSMDATMGNTCPKIPGTKPIVDSLKSARSLQLNVMRDITFDAALVELKRPTTTKPPRL